MRISFAAAITAVAVLFASHLASPASADALAECKDFFAKFEKCADGLAANNRKRRAFTSKPCAARSA